MVDAAYIIHVDHESTIKSTAEETIKMMNAKGFYAHFNVNQAEKAYEEKLSRLGVQAGTHYDILIVNIINELLSANDLEIFALFDGFDNCKITVVSKAQGLLLRQLFCA
jgi:hypothetical protein